MVTKKLNNKVGNLLHGSDVTVQSRYAAPDVVLMSATLTSSELVTLSLGTCLYLVHVTVWLARPDYRTCHEGGGAGGGGFYRSIAERIVRSMVKAGEITFRRQQQQQQPATAAAASGLRRLHADDVTGSGGGGGSSAHDSSSGSGSCSLVSRRLSTISLTSSSKDRSVSALAVVAPTIRGKVVTNFGKWMGPGVRRYLDPTSWLPHTVVSGNMSADAI